MYIHTHATEEGDTLVLHINRTEAEGLVASVSATLEENPEGESFAVTLGHVQAEEHQHGTTFDPGSGLIIP